MTISMTVDFRPSDVVLSEPFPFVNTFRRAESECMAAVMVVIMAESTDEWRPLKTEEIAEWMRKAIHRSRGSRWGDLLSNPFLVPHPHSLVKHGLCIWCGDDTLEFTELGLKAMQPWVRPAPKEGEKTNDDMGK